MSYQNSIIMASIKVAAGIVVYKWMEHKMLYTTIGSTALFEQNCSFYKASGNRSYFVNSLHKLVAMAIHHGFASFLLHDEL